MVDKSLFTTIFTQILSPDGNYLLAGSNYGELSIFDLQKVIDPDEVPSNIQKQKPSHKLKIVEDSGITCLCSTPKFLVIGCKGKILGYDWKNILSPKNLKLSWQIDVPRKNDVGESIGVNKILFGNDSLYAGCGDSCIYVFHLEDGKLSNTMKENDSFIHDMVFRNDKTLVSCSEDGSVLVWDLGLKQSVINIKPYTNPDLNRPNVGKWIGAVDVESDWMVCGGGPKTSLWHLGSRDVTTIFNSNNHNGSHVNSFYEDRVMIGGNECLDQFTLQGDIICSIPSSSKTVYSIVLQDLPHHVLSLAGSSPYIDLCTNFNYRDQILSVRD